MKVKKHWRDNQNRIKDFTALKTPIKTQPKIILDNVTILKIENLIKNSIIEKNFFLIPDEN